MATERVASPMTVWFGLNALTMLVWDVLAARADRAAPRAWRALGQGGAFATLVVLLAKALP